MAKYCDSTVAKSRRSKAEFSPRIEQRFVIKLLIYRVGKNRSWIVLQICLSAEDSQRAGMAGSLSHFGISL